jgi:hypothetical protein
MPLFPPVTKAMLPAILRDAVFIFALTPSLDNGSIRLCRPLSSARRYKALKKRNAG